MGDIVFGYLIEMAGLPLQEITEFIKDIAVQAGKIMLEGASGDKELEFKSSVDIVTDFEFLGEEEAATQGETLSDAPTWVVDPIDGTTHFVHNIRFSSVSISLVVEKIAVIGVVYNPYDDHLYHAFKGNGATSMINKSKY